MNFERQIYMDGKTKKFKIIDRNTNEYKIFQIGDEVPAKCEGCGHTMIIDDIYDDGLVTLDCPIKGDNCEYLMRVYLDINGEYA